MRPEDLGVHTGMQFKKEIVDAKNGVTDQLKGQRDYNIYDGGVLTVWENAKGERFAVDGHHRRELAQRAERFVEPDPNGGVREAPRQIAVQVLRESDGWTPEGARAYGVRRNLIEGKGRAIDAADALVSAGGADALRKDLAKLPKSALTRDTAGLAELSADGRDLVRNRKVDASVAAGIGKALPGDTSRQKIALEQASAAPEIRTYEDGMAVGREVAREDLVSANVRQLGLDGLDAPAAVSTAAQRAEIKQALLRRALAERGEAKKGLDLNLREGETIDTEARLRIAEQLGETTGAASTKVGAALEYDPSLDALIRQTAKEYAEKTITKAEAISRTYDALVASASRPIAEITSGKPADPVVSTKAETPAIGKRVTLQVNGEEKAIDLSPDQAARWDTAVRQYGEDRARLQARPADEMRDKQLKALAMRHSAEKRQIADLLTSKEAQEAGLQPLEVEEDTSTIPLFQTRLGEKPHNQRVIEEIERVGFVPARAVAEGLGERPEYLDRIVSFVLDQRRKVVEGKLTTRDVAKAYYITLASQGAGARSAALIQERLRAQGIELPLAKEFTGVNSKGIVTVRPEDAAAAWLGTPDGQRALNTIEKGEYVPELWEKAAAVRHVFGDPRFKELNALGTPKAGAANLTNLSPITEAINAAKGNPALIEQALRRLNGIGEGKSPFIRHLVGFGETPTVDARQVNMWLTGRGTIGGMKDERAGAARLFKRSSSDKRVAEYMAGRVKRAVGELRQILPGGKELPEEAAGAVLHQWLWDRARPQADATANSNHAIYTAMALFQKRVPKAGDSVKGDGGNTFTVESVDEAKGSVRIRITDKDGKLVGTMPAIPLARFQEERRVAARKAARQNLSDVINAPRSLQSSFDLSAPLRQGAILTAAQPAVAARASIKMFSALNDTQYKQIVEAIASRPEAKLYEESGLYLASREPSGKLGDREEAFMSRLVSNLPHVKKSEQAYVAYLDTLRADSFDTFSDELTSAGLTPESHPEEFAAVARFINAATGRGELPQVLKGSADILNGLLYSPRFAASRLEVLNPVTYISMPPAARRIAARSAARYAGVVALTMTLTKLAGAEVGLDPESSDFLKIKVGTTRYDLGAGTIQYMRLIWQTSRGLKNNFTGAGNDRGQNPSEIAAKFARGKLAPFPSYVADAAIGTTFSREKFDPWKGAYERVLPLLAKDLWDVWHEEGAAGIAKTAPSIFGIGTSTYADRAPKGSSSGGSMPGMPSLPSMPSMPSMPGLK